MGGNVLKLAAWAASFSTFELRQGACGVAWRVGRVGQQLAPLLGDAAHVQGARLPQVTGVVQLDVKGFIRRAAVSVFSEVPAGGGGGGLGAGAASAGGAAGSAGGCGSSGSSTGEGTLAGTGASAAL